MCLQGDNCPLSIINCQLSIESPVLTSHFPDSAFSGNAHFRNFVPIRKSRVKYFKICPSERIEINLYSHNYTVHNAKKHPPNPFPRSKAPVVGFVRTNDYRRTDVSAPSWSFVRTKAGTCFHFLEPEGARFRMCEIASVRVKRPTEGNGQTEKQNRRKGNRRKRCQCAKRKSPEKGLPGHQLVFRCKESPSRAIRLTF